MSKEIIKDSILPFLFIAMTISSFYYKSPVTGICIAFLAFCTVPIVYKALDYYNKELCILISALASIGGFLIFCFYSNSINILSIFVGRVFSFIAFYESYKPLETTVSGHVKIRRILAVSKSR